MALPPADSLPVSGAAGSGGVAQVARLPSARAHGHGGMAGAPMVIPADSPAAAFSCTPYAPGEMAARYARIGTGGYSHKIATRSADAQRLFDVGMLHAYGYNQPAAIAAFEEGLAADAKAPMLYWGIAYASAPIFNKAAVPLPDAANPYPTFTPEDVARGKGALEQARRIMAELRSNAQSTRWWSSPLALLGRSGVNKDTLERDSAYIDALYEMYSTGQYAGPEWEAGALRYAAAMEALAGRYSSDADAPALAAEAFANLTPWDFWRAEELPAGSSSSALAPAPYTSPDPVSGSGSPGKPFNVYGASVRYVPTQYTEHVLELLGAAFQRDAGHPMAAHMMVHLTEGSAPGRGPNSAGRAEAGADVLASGRYPAGHLTHMAGHTYLRLGRWADTQRAQEKALKQDEGDVAKCTMPYGPEHDASMALYAAMQSGDPAASRAWAARILSLPATFGKYYETDGREPSNPLLVAARFADWDAILQYSEEQMTANTRWGVPIPPGAPAFNTAMYHYTRVLALAAQAEALAQAAPITITIRPPGTEDAEAQKVPVLSVSVALPTTAAAAAAGGAAPADPDPGAAPQLLGLGMAGFTVGAQLSPPGQASISSRVPPDALARVAAEVQAVVALASAAPPDPQSLPLSGGGGIGVWTPGFKHLLRLAALESESRLALLKGDLPRAAAIMQQAYTWEPAGDPGYSEPPRQYRPVGQCLAWLLVQQGKLDEAARLYAKDLYDFPDNPWALTGLRDMLRMPLGEDAITAAGLDAKMQPLLAVQAVPGKLALALASAQPGDAFQARERGPTGAGAGGKDASGTGAVTPVPSSCPAFSVIPSAPSPASAEAISNGA